MRRLLQVIGIAVAILAALAAGIVIFWINSDPAVWRNALARLAIETLGRELTIAGPIKPSFSISQGLTLTISDLQLANAKGLTLEAMLTVPKLEIAVDLGALFSNTVHIRGVKLDGATLNLAKLATGDNNWTFKKDTHAAPATQAKNLDAPAAATSDGRVYVFAVDRVTIDDLRLTYTAPGDRQKVQVKSLVLNNDEQMLQLQALLRYNDSDYGLLLTARGLQALLSGQRQGVTASLKTARHQLNVEGVYSRHEAWHRLDDLSATFDGAAISGEAAAAFDQPRARISVRLKVAEWSLPGTSPAVNGAAAEPAGLPPSPVFSRQPLPWSLLDVADLNGVFEITNVTRNSQTLGPVHGELALSQARLKAKALIQPPMAMQPVQIDLAANAAQQARLQMAAPALDPSLWASLLGNRPLVQSPASITIDLAGHGAALHDLAATAEGTVAMAAQPGKLNTAAIPATARRALDAMLGPRALDEATLGCLKAAFTVQNGIMRANGPQSGIGLDSSVLAISGDGQIDLGAETLALRLVAAPKLPGLEQTLVPLHVIGALTDPRVNADLAAVAGQMAGNLVTRLVGTVPSARLGLAAAKALGKDPASLIEQPQNPCIVASAAAPAAPAPDTVTAPSALPTEMREKLKGARQLLDQFIKAAEPPAALSGPAVDPAP